MNTMKKVQQALGVQPQVLMGTREALVAYKENMGKIQS